ncbi:MAG: hypothetical protein WC792_02775 [Candidatus Micrarchaeia archaeon]|jgi:hypothetical protein
MPADAKVLEYVKACLTAGMKTDDVIGNLKKTGWTSGEIADALEEVLGEIDKKEAEQKQTQQPVRPQTQAPEQPAGATQAQSRQTPAVQSQPAYAPEQKPARKVLPWLTEPVYEKPAYASSASNSATAQGTVAQKKEFTPLPQSGLPQGKKPAWATAMAALKETEKPKLPAIGKPQDALLEKSAQPETEARQAQQTGKPEVQPAQAEGFPHALGAEDFLNPKWLSEHWIYLLAVVLAIAFVLVVLYSAFWPYIEPALSPAQ